jgi:hypothetical protein
MPKRINNLLSKNPTAVRVYIGGGSARNLRLPHRAGRGVAAGAPRRRAALPGPPRRDGRRVVVIWRETNGWTLEDYQRDAAFVAKRRLTEGAD